jgi:DivIVA domain-containing protein
MAADNDPTDLLPLLRDDEPHFDVAMRGYDKRQVDAYLQRAETEIAQLQSGRDSALASSADRAAQLASRDAQIESLKRQLDKASDLNPANMSDRIRDMLQLANEEAAQTRRAAEEEADRVLVAARADGERVRGEAAAEQQRLIAAAKQRSAEADQKLAQARVLAKAERENASAEVARLTEASNTERARLDAEATKARSAAERQADKRRKTADEDFEITLRQRRTAAEREVRIAHDNASQLARQLVADAEKRAAELVAEARTQAQNLANERVRIDESLRELHANLGALVNGATSK